MKFGLISVILAAMSFMQGCSDTIDGSSVAAYKRSVEKMSEKMMPTQQRQLAQDMLLASESVQKMNAGTKVFAGLNEEFLIETMAKDLNGKSVTDIHKMAEKRRAENREVAIKTLTKEIAAAEVALAKETGFRDELQKITFGDVSVSVVTRPGNSFYYGMQEMRHWAYQVRVKNGSEFTVKGIKFRDYPENHVISSNGYIPSTFDEPLKPGEEKVLNVYGLIDEKIREENLRVPPLDSKQLVFEMIPEGKPGQYNLDRSSDIDGFTQKLTDKRQQLAKLQTEKAQ